MKKWWIILICAVIIVGVFSSFASDSPDGLERVALEKGFFNLEEEPVIKGIFPDYSINGIKKEGLAIGLAGVVGTCITFLLVIFIFKLCLKDKTKEA